MNKYKWCEYYGYKPNDNLEMIFEIRFQDYFKKCVTQNKKKYGKNYTQADIVKIDEIDNMLNQIKKSLFN